MPKTELHLHLEGAIPLATLWQLIQKYGGDPDIPSIGALEERFQYRDFDHFLQTWFWKNGFLREYVDFELIAQAVADDLAGQAVVYAEIFFSPADFSRQGLDLQVIATAVRRGFERSTGDIQIALIVDLVRDFGAAQGMRVLEMMHEVRHQGIIGIGIGGTEHEYPAQLFTEVFHRARQLGFHTTAHAGEAAGPESIWSALTDLEVERIGHATSAIGDSNLVDELVARQIPLEMCPVSNLRTGAVSDLREHPILELLRCGAVVTVNTDDPKMFNTSLDYEFTRLADAFEIADQELLQLAENGIHSAWCDADLKKRMVGELRAYFRKHGRLVD